MGRRGPPEGRNQWARLRLKEKAWAYAHEGMSAAAIGELLGERPRTIQRWLAQIVVKDEWGILLLANSHHLEDLRQNALRADALALEGLGSQSDRAYWWGLYEPVVLMLHKYALREELGASRCPEPPQEV